MNERVEKFARECGAWNQVYGNRNFMIDEHFDIEKFARLIVQECANQVDWILAEGGKTQGDLIKQHLGVES
jgi:hypothetical protein